MESYPVTNGIMKSAKGTFNQGNIIQYYSIAANANHYLNVDELPGQTTIYDRNINLSNKEVNLHDSVGSRREPFLRNIFDSNISSSRCLLFM